MDIGAELLALHEGLVFSALSLVRAIPGALEFSYLGVHVTHRQPIGAMKRSK
jgi:hypothetical protein